MDLCRGVSWSNGVWNNISVCLQEIFNIAPCERLVLGNVIPVKVRVNIGMKFSLNVSVSVMS